MPLTVVTTIMNFDLVCLAGNDLNQVGKNREGIGTILNGLANSFQIFAEDFAKTENSYLHTPLLNNPIFGYGQRGQNHFNEKLIENIEYIKDQYPDKYEAWKTSVKKSFDNNTFQSPGAKIEWKKNNPNTMRWFQSYDTTLKLRGGSRKKSVSKRKTLKKRKY